MGKFIAAAVSGAAIAVVAVAGCTSGTTTIREISAAAAPVAHTSAPVKPPPAVTRTVTSKPSPTVTQTAPATVVVVPTPVYVTAPAPGPQAGTECAPGLFVNAVTTCPFAENVDTAYADAGIASGYVSAYSPVTGMTYTMYCNDTGTAVGTGEVDCTGGDNALVVIDG